MGKSAGSGGILAELLKQASQQVLKILTAIFSICLIKQYDIPKEWKERHIDPIHKK